MAIEYLVYRRADNVVIQSGSGSANALPADTPERAWIDTSGTNLREQWDTLRQEMAVDGRGDSVTWDGTQLAIPADPRPVFRFEADKLIVDADGVDFATLTITKLNAQGGTQTGFNVSRILRHDESGRKFRLTFNSGVATKALRGRQSGDLRFASTPAYKIETPLVIEFVE